MSCMSEGEFRQYVDIYTEKVGSGKRGEGRKKVSFRGLGTKAMKGLNW